MTDEERRLREFRYIAHIDRVRRKLASNQEIRIKLKVLSKKILPHPSAFLPSHLKPLVVWFGLWHPVDQRSSHIL